MEDCRKKQLLLISYLFLFGAIMFLLTKWKSNLKYIPMIAVSGYAIWFITMFNAFGGPSFMNILTGKICDPEFQKPKTPEK